MSPSCLFKFSFTHACTAATEHCLLTLKRVECGSPMLERVECGLPMLERLECGSPMSERVECGLPMLERVECGSPMLERVECGLHMLERVECGLPMLERVECGLPMLERVECGSPMLERVECGLFCTPLSKGQQPTSPWQIRHYSSAGSMKIRTAGFYSRQAALRVRFRCKSECKDFRLKEASCFAFSLLRYTGSALLHSLSTLCVRAHHPLISSSCLPPISFTHACTTKTRSVHLPSFSILLHTCSSPLHVTVLSL